MKDLKKEVSDRLPYGIRGKDGILIIEREGTRDENE
jgi:hypothetical protein